MAIEDKELFVQTIKDIMIPVSFGVGYLILTVFLSMLWLPSTFIMAVIGIGMVISFVTYKERLAQKKRDERAKARGLRYTNT